MKAVLVIDMLEDFFQDGPLRRAREGLTTHINALTAEARKEEIPVIWARQEFRDDLDDAFLAMKKKDIRITIAGTHGARILSELEQASEDHEIVKKRYSAFFGTGLDDLLSKHFITELILTGVNSHACVRTTAIDAYQRDMNVTIPVECVASRDVEHHEVSLEYLGDEIATVASLENVLASMAI